MLKKPSSRSEKSSLIKKKALSYKKKTTKLIPREGIGEEEEPKKSKRGENNKGNSEHMKKIRGMRKFYNKAMPKLSCNSCSFQGSCPKFKAGYECAFIPFLQSHDIRDEKDLMGEMRNIVTANVQRMHLAATFETLGGGAPSLELTEQMNGTFNQMKELYNLMMDVEESEAEFTDEQSLVSQLFGDLNSLIGSVAEAQDEIDQIPEDESKTLEGKSSSTPAISLDDGIIELAPEEAKMEALIKEQDTSDIVLSAQNRTLDKADDTVQDIVVVSSTNKQ